MNNARKIKKIILKGFRHITSKVYSCCPDIL
jgi:hypothetical protein